MPLTTPDYTRVRYQVIHSSSTAGFRTRAIFLRFDSGGFSKVFSHVYIRPKCTSAYGCGWDTAVYK